MINIQVNGGCLDLPTFRDLERQSVSDLIEKLLRLVSLLIFFPWISKETNMGTLENRPSPTDDFS